MLTLRPATAKDAATIVQFIRDLAEYEREPQAAVLTEADIVRDGFDAAPKFRVILADWDGSPAGFAFFFYNYSTWLGRPGLYLEDLFVRPQFRGRGIGKALLASVAQIAVDENCCRLQWQVLDWNQPAIDFYHSMGARPMNQWITMRAEGDEIKQLAAAGKAPAQ